jgi:hypothetical protein
MLPEGQSIDEILNLGSMNWVDDGEQDFETKVTIKTKKGK